MEQSVVSAQATVRIVYAHKQSLPVLFIHYGDQPMRYNDDLDV